MKKSILVCAVALLGFTQASAQDYERGIFNHLGANLSVGTEGISIGVAAPCTDYLEFGLGINFFPGIKVKEDANVSGIPAGFGYSNKIKITGSMSRTTFDFKTSFYPFANKSSFFIAAGLSFGGKALFDLSGQYEDWGKLDDKGKEYVRNSIELDKYKLILDDEGRASGDIRVNAVRPYVGLGFGRLVPKNRVGFRFELGCQFMGHMKVYQNDQESHIDEALKDNDSEWSKLIDKLTVYPVLKFTLTGRIL